MHEASAQRLRQSTRAGNAQKYEPMAWGSPESRLFPAASGGAAGADVHELRISMQVHDRFEARADDRSHLLP